MKLSKVFSIVAVAVMLLASVSNVVLAINPSNITANTSGTDGIQTIGSSVVGVLQVAGSVVAVVVLIVVGIKYMMGSAEEKAEYKKTMIPYIVGAVLIFAASSLAGWIYEWATTIE